MGRLIYLMNVSLDGFITDAAGSLGWARVDEEVHRWFNDESRATEVFLYGRRLYETMAAYWPTAESDPAATPVMLEFARIWAATPKVVFSRSLEHVLPGHRLVRGDVAGELAKLRAEFAGDMSVGGATLASAFVERGLVDEYRLAIHPAVLGGGTPFWPRVTAPIELELLGTRRSASGVVFVRYAVAGRPPAES